MKTLSRARNTSIAPSSEKHRSWMPSQGGGGLA
jgi:hypothetical protein